jgi:hypothetical protein
VILNAICGLHVAGMKSEEYRSGTNSRTTAIHRALNVGRDCRRLLRPLPASAIRSLPHKRNHGMPPKSPLPPHACYPSRHRSKGQIAISLSPDAELSPIHLSRRPPSLIIFLGLFSVFHNVAFLKQDLLQDPLPLWLAPQEKFQVHSEMLEFLALRISHNRLGIRIFFD